MQKTKSAVAGVPIAVICACVMRGGSKPLVVLVRSRMALAFGVKVPIPTLVCARTAIALKMHHTIAITADASALVKGR